MILLVAPDQEGLVVVVEDATSSGPKAASVRSLEEPIALFKEEVIINQFLLHLLAHASEWVEGAL